ncbi:MAG: CcmD family protein [Bryobacteraceae bacterium]
MDSRNLQFMFYGFLAAWMIVVVYVILLATRERRLRNELERVRKMVEKEPRSQKPEARITNQA